MSNQEWHGDLSQRVTHHHSTVPIVIHETEPQYETTSNSKNILSSTAKSIVKSFSIILLIIFLIFIIYYVVPAGLGWFTPPAQGGLCRACHDSLQHPLNDGKNYLYYTKVFRSSCSCDCWDGRAKGPYPRGNFKYIYYQVEPTTLWLVFVSILILISFYQSIYNVLNLIQERKCNYWILPVYCIGWYGLYYSYGSHFNYFNEDSHQLSWHQFYFTFTEIGMVFVTYLLLNKDITEGSLFSRANQLSRSMHEENVGDDKTMNIMTCTSKPFSFMLWCVLSTALTHTVQIALDQGLSKWGEGIFLRDMLLFLSDFPYMIMSSYYLGLHHVILYYFKWITARHSGTSNTEKLKDFVKTQTRNLGFCGISVALMVMFLSNVTFGG
ncbi:hypothetical protein C9374_000366 [Naegleria lovaniensis]|uniref:Uncharacterized protein n=1 Tax=Naegleria lovaniensis TaxID=51637 RepID=A0AA88GAS8_NAELO|nr:uncharacterized protein C9374_000366 [Naegleria lovaniensis]KAG2370589.1 hypothetical protein C9374_000366 [Naegleria lovaniensis]